MCSRDHVRPITGEVFLAPAAAIGVVKVLNEIDEKEIF